MNRTEPFCRIRRSYLALALLLPLTHSAVAQTPTNFKIAFIGDQGLGRDARAVLNLIKSEGANAVVHQGDFDYNDDPQDWDNQINNILGANFPYFASVGNHDDGKFYGSGGYQEFMEARLNRLGITWDGDLGVKSSFHHSGIFFVLTGPDVLGENHNIYIRDQLAQDTSLWSISSWHKNMAAMQVGGKSNSTGWGVYEESRKAGAIIATGHEHSYSRTHLLSSCQNRTVASTSDTLVLTKDEIGTSVDEGRTFVFVSGLGGRSIRDQERCFPTTPPYGCNGEWASIYTSDQGANYGALFGIFNLDDVPNLAKFYFKDIDGVVPDSFFVISNVEDLPVPVELSFFSAVAHDDLIALSWETKTETNNLGFDIERSHGGRSFEKIAFLKGHGTSTINRSYMFEDRNLKVGKYMYRIRQIDLEGTSRYSSPVQAEISAPEEFYLSQNYPNPFNPETSIRFQLPHATRVTLRVFNAVGQKVLSLIEREYEAGYHTVVWNGRDRDGSPVASGLYVYTLRAEGFSRVKKMLILR